MFPGLGTALWASVKKEAPSPGTVYWAAFPGLGGEKFRLARLVLTYDHLWSPSFETGHKTKNEGLASYDDLC